MLSKCISHLFSLYFDACHREILGVVSNIHSRQNVYFRSLLKALQLANGLQCKRSLENKSSLQIEVMWVFRTWAPAVLLYQPAPVARACLLTQPYPQDLSSTTRASVWSESCCYCWIGWWEVNKLRSPDLGLKSCRFLIEFLEKNMKRTHLPRGPDSWLCSWSIVHVAWPKVTLLGKKKVYNNVLC